MIRFNTIAFVIVLFVGAFAFYWHELRPGEIRRECADIAKAIRFEKGKELKAEKNLPIARQLDEAMKNEYTFCLHSKGL